MHDDQIDACRKHSDACGLRAGLKDRYADEWARLASHREMLARVRERMPNIADRHDSERVHVPNAIGPNGQWPPPT